MKKKMILGMPIVWYGHGAGEVLHVYPPFENNSENRV